ncbi:T9SS type B sorting domain-containing protein [Lutibacter sp. A64]|uniref:T9SS type B sorting domain-containing protein n=1 Tax=Lutibacter sp. A64 TaxID=2918526 RepID=UPI001F06C0BE|nr:T9SS type B sorting domain-containing protein [Lutibacter sp. A64]UMB54847.1 T9SS type B sorting domain-containing protein [Lutibacter sp. A64]
MKKQLLIIFLLLNLTCFSQGEANIWYFGEHAGIDFNSGTPVTIDGGQINTREGCSSFSDTNGNLLFYSDGKTVWNKNHTPMPNGLNLKGNASSTQSAMIIPKPSSTNIYYLFTVGASIDNGENGFYYYTIDMNQNSGLGDIINGPVDLNEGKAENWSEKVAAINGKECETFWVVSYVQNEFKAYKVSATGVANTPITSNSSYFSDDPRGYLKISPDGKKIAIAHLGEKRFILYDFNNETGSVTNPQTLNLTAPNDFPYGAEFSGNGEKLYVTGSNNYFNQVYAEYNNPNNHTSSLYQFDITKNTTVEINSSKVILDTGNQFRSALQLGPDQKIYRTMSSTYDNGSSYLSVIESPENDGNASNYIPNAISLGTNKSTQGLPPFIASIFSTIEITNNETQEIITNQTIKLCTGNDYIFNTESLDGNPIYNWKFNDTIIPGTQNLKNLSLTNVTKSDEGLYNLEINLVDKCGKAILYKGEFEVEVYDPPTAPSKIIYDQCDIDTNSLDGITLFNLNSKLSEITNNNTDLEVQFFASENDFKNNNPILNPSAYNSTTNENLILKITNKNTNCFTLGEMELNVYETPTLENYTDVYLCENDLGIGTETSIGSGVASFNFEEKRTAINNLYIDYEFETTVEFYNNTNDLQLQINQLSGIEDYPDSEIFVRISNKENNNCISAGKFNIIINKIPLPNSVIEDVILCIGTIEDSPKTYSVELNVDTYVNGDNYQWYFNNSPITNATNPIYFAEKEGLYEVKVFRDYKNNSCGGFSLFNVKESNIPVLYTKDITILDDSDNNTITIDTTNLGIGTYEFALNSYNGDYQDEPYFDNVSAGIHTIYTRDINGCGFTSIEVSVIGFPRFFTPNGDGYNDTWKVLGANNDFYPTSNIYIFDRFGKIITSLNPNGNGWDGTLNGQYLPSTDYWFSVELTDKDGNTRIKNGHFSLIRK